MKELLGRATEIVSLKQGSSFLLLLIIWPFLALFTALTNYQNKICQRVVYFFLVYYGLTLVIDINNGYVDGVGYVLKLVNNSTLPFSDFFNVVGGIYATDTTVDIVEPLISFVVSRFTSQHGILFAAYAALFGFFYLKSINFLYEEYRINRGINALVFLIFFCSIMPITFINGFRMWTAGWIFFYGAYYVVLKRERNYLFVALAASLVHWSYLSVNLVLIIYYFLGNKTLLYSVILIASYTVPSFITPYLQLVGIRLGGGLQSRIEAYSGESYSSLSISEFDNSAWFIRIDHTLLLIFLILTIIYIRVFHYSSIKHKSTDNLFSFLILFLAFVNFAKPIPAFGSRFQVIFYLFAILYIFLFSLRSNSKKLDIITLIGLLPMTIHFLILFRQGSMSINAWILTPGIGVPLLVPPLSLAEILF